MRKNATRVIYKENSMLRANNKVLSSCKQNMDHFSDISELSVTSRAQEQSVVESEL